MPEKIELNELESGLQNLAQYVAREKFAALKKEINGLLKAIKISTPEAHTNIKKLLIQIATSQVSAAIGNALANISGGAIQSLLDTTTKAIMAEVDKHLSGELEQDIGQVFDAISNMAETKIRNMTRQVVSENVEVISANLDLAEQREIAEFSDHNSKKVKDAATKILEGSGGDIIAEFYDEIRKQPEVVTFIKGNTANLPKEVISKLAEHDFFVDANNVMSQSHQFDQMHNYSLDTAKVKHAFKENNSGLLITNSDLISYLNNMNKILEFIVEAKDKIPEHSNWNKSFPVVEMSLHVSSHHKNVKVHNQEFFSNSKTNYINLMRIIDRVVKKERITPIEYNALIKGMEEFHLASQANIFYEMLNEMVYDANIAASGKNEKLFPYYYRGSDEIKLIVKEAQARRKLQGEFELKNFSHYVNDIITRGEKTHDVPAFVTKAMHKIDQAITGIDAGQEFAIAMMDELGYVKKMNLGALKNRMVYLQYEILKITVANPALTEKGTIIGDLLAKYDEVFMSNVSAPTDEKLQEDAAILTRLLNTYHFSKEGNKAKREPYPILQISFEDQHKIPRSIVEQMRSEVEKCNDLQKKSHIATSQQSAVQETKSADVKAEQKAVSDIDLQKLKVGLQNVACFLAEEKFNKLKQEVNKLVNLIAKHSVEEQEKIKRTLITVAIGTISATIGTALASVTGGATNSLIAMTTSALMHEVEKQLSGSIQSNLGQLFDTISKATTTRLIYELTDRAITANAEMIKAQTDKEELKKISSITNRTSKNNVGDAATRILEGRGEDVVKEFYDELRKQPEVIVFVSGAAAHFPKKAFKKLEKYNFFVNAEEIKDQSKIFEERLHVKLNKDKVLEYFQVETLDGKKTYLLSIDMSYDITNQLNHMSKLLEFIVNAKDKLPNHSAWNKLCDVEQMHLKIDQFHFFPDAKEKYAQLLNIVERVKNKIHITAEDYAVLVKGMEDFQLISHSQQFFKTLNQVVYDVNILANHDDKLYPYYYMDDAEKNAVLELFIKEAQARRIVTGNFDERNFHHYVNNVINREEAKQELAVDAMHKLGYINIVKDRSHLESVVADLDNKILQLTLSHPTLAGKGTLIDDLLIKRNEIYMKNNKKTLSDEDLQKVAAIYTRILNIANFKRAGSKSSRVPYPILEGHFLHNTKVPRGVVEEMRFEAMDCQVHHGVEYKPHEMPVDEEQASATVESTKTADAHVTLQKIKLGLENVAKFIAQEKLAVLNDEIIALADSIAATTVEERGKTKRILLRVAISTVSGIIGGTLAAMTGGTAYSLIAATTSMLMNQLEKHLTVKVDQLVDNIEQIVDVVSSLAQTNMADIADNANMADIVDNANMADIVDNANMADIVDNAVNASRDLILSNLDKPELRQLVEITENPSDTAVKNVAHKILEGHGKDIVTEFYNQLRKQPEAITFVGGHAARFSEETFLKLEEHDLFVNSEKVGKKADAFKNRFNSGLDEEKVSACFQEEKRNGKACYLLSTDTHQDIKYQLTRMSKLLEFVTIAKDRLPNHKNWGKVLPHSKMPFFSDPNDKYLQLKDIVDRANKKELISAEEFITLKEGMKEFQRAFHEQEFFNHLNQMVFDLNVIAEAQDKLFPYYMGEEARKDVLDLIIREAQVRRQTMGHFDLESFSHYANDVIVKGEKQELAFTAMKHLQYVEEIKTEKELRKKVEELKEIVFNLGISDRMSDLSLFKQKTTTGLLKEYHNLLKANKSEQEMDVAELQKAAAILTQAINITRFKQNGNQAKREPYPIFHGNLLKSHYVFPNSVLKSMQFESASCREFHPKTPLRKTVTEKVEMKQAANDEVMKVEVKEEVKVAPAAENKAASSTAPSLWKAKYDSQLKELDVDCKKMLADQSKGPDWIKKYSERIDEINQIYKELQDDSYKKDHRMQYVLNNLGVLINEVNDKSNKSKIDHRNNLGKSQKN